MEWSGWVTKAHIKMFVMANGFVCVCVCVCVCLSVCLSVSLAPTRTAWEKNMLMWSISPSANSYY